MQKQRNSICDRTTCEPNRVACLLQETPVLSQFNFPFRVVVSCAEGIQSRLLRGRREPQSNARDSNIPHRETRSPPAKSICVRKRATLYIIKMPFVTRIASFRVSDVTISNCCACSRSLGAEKIRKTGAIKVRKVSEHEMLCVW